MQQDILAVVAHSAEANQVRAVKWGREDSGGRAVGTGVVRQNYVEADDAVLAGARQVLVEGGGERDNGGLPSLVAWR